MYNQPCYPMVIPSVYHDHHQELPVTPPHVSSLLLPMSLSPPSPTPSSTSSSSSSNSDEQPPSPEEVDDTSPEKVVRTRISFTTSQQIDLEGEFQKSAYLHKARRIEIAKRLQLEEKHIKVWFQNRRMKSKRESASKPSIKTQQLNSENRTTRNVASPKPCRKYTLLQKVLKKNAAASQVPVSKAQYVLKEEQHAVWHSFNNPLNSQIPLSINQAKVHHPSQQQNGHRLVLLPQRRLQQIPFQHSVQYLVPQEWRQPQQFYQPSTLPQQQQVMIGAPQFDSNYLPFEQTKNQTSITPQSVPSTIGINTDTFEDMKSFGLQDREDNINLNAYFNNGDSSPSLDVLIDQDDIQNPPKRIKMDEDEFDFNKILANLVDPPVLNDLMSMDSNHSDSTMDRDDFDVDDFINNLDKYVTYPGFESNT